MTLSVVSPHLIVPFMAAASYIEVHAHLKIGSKCTHPELQRITVVLLVENAFNSLLCMHVKMTLSLTLLHPLTTFYYAVLPSISQIR